MTNNTNKTNSLMGLNNGHGKIQLNSDEALGLAKEIKRIWQKRKIGERDFKEALARPGMLTNDLVESLTVTIEQSTDAQAREFYQLCDRDLRASILIPDGEVNLTLYSKLELAPSEISRAFLIKNKLPRPRSSAYTIHFQNFFEDEIYAELVFLLQGLRLPEKRRVLEAMGPKVLHLLAASEIDDVTNGNRQSAKDLFCCMELNDIVPLEFAFLNILQEAAPDVYARVIRELNNMDWPEFRTMFYELQKRNETLLRHCLEKEEETGGLEYLNKILED